MIRLGFLLALVLTLGACSHQDLISASPDEKEAAFKARRSHWKHKMHPLDYGRGLSVQFFRGKDVVATEDKLAVHGGMGMASIITHDGYALTAAHVVEGSSQLDSVLTTGGDDAEFVHLRWDYTTKPGKGKNLELVVYRAKKSGRDKIGRIYAGKVRVVEVFSNRDLALVKLPIDPQVWFKVGGALQAPGTVLFAAGNGGTPYAGMSSGEVRSVRRKGHSIRTVNTSVPLAVGDSGSPVFDADGHLVGIVSHVLPSRWLPFPSFGHSSLRMIDPEKLRFLIAKDREAVRQGRIEAD